MSTSKRSRAARRTKWRFAIGTISRVPGSNLHYLMFDLDQKDVLPSLNWLHSKVVISKLTAQPTARGWHIYTSVRLTWTNLIRLLSHIPTVDRKWVSIGQSRGYFFLADKDAVHLPWPVHRMIIHAKEKR